MRGEAASRRNPRSRAVRVKAVVFDLDGTLVHSAVDFVKLKRRTMDLLSHRGLPVEEFSTEMKTYDMMRLASVLLKDKGLTEQDIALVNRGVEEVWNRVELESVSKTSPIEGAEKTLLELKKRGLKIGVVTRGCREYAIEALKVTGLLELVDVIVGRGDTVEPKPSQEPLVKAVKMLGLKTDEVVMVGDGVDDAQCAYGAKVRFIGVTSEATKTGFLEGCETTLTDIRNLVDMLN